MPHFGKRSLSRLEGVHPDLEKLFRHVVEGYDCTILCGRRGEEDQNEAFDTGRSKLRYPQSKHNGNPSRAVDVAPYPVDWNNLKRFYHFAGYVLRTAHQLDLNIRWGGDWDSDLDFNDQNFNDLPHFELR